MMVWVILKIWNPTLAVSFFLNFFFAFFGTTKTAFL